VERRNANSGDHEGLDNTEVVRDVRDNAKDNAEGGNTVEPIDNMHKIVTMI